MGRVTAAAVFPIHRALLGSSSAGCPSLGCDEGNFSGWGQLREELGLQIMAGKPAPPKRALIGVNKKPDQIERRRKELEQWLWRLVDDPHVARSKMLHTFLELSEAARLIHRCTFTCVFQDWSLLASALWEVIQVFPSSRLCVGMRAPTHGKQTRAMWH